MTEDDDIDLANEPAAQPSPEAPKEFSSDQGGLREAAKALVDSREETIDRQGLEPGTPEQPTFEVQDNPPPIDELWYRDPDKPDQPLAEDVPKTVKQAARDLAEYHAAQAAAREAEVTARQPDPQPLEQPQEPQPAQEPPATPAQPDLAAVQAQAEAFQQGIQISQRALADQVQAEMPELIAITALCRQDPARGDVALRDFAAKNPQKWQRFQQLDGELRASMARSAQVAQLQREVAQTQFKGWAQQQDALFDQQHPGVSGDPDFFKDALKYLESKGVNKQQVRAAWESDATFRSAQAQSMLHDAVVGWRAEQRAAQSRKNLNQHMKPVPPVVRPGRGTLPTEGRNAQDIELLNDRLDRATNVQQGARIGAQLLREMRRAR